MKGVVEVEMGAGSATASPDVDPIRAHEILAMVRAGRSTYGRSAVVLGIPPERLAGDGDKALAVYRAYVGRVSPSPRLDLDLPETVTAAMPGRPLDAVVGHPLLEGAGCVVTGVEGWRAMSRTVIRLALKPVRWCMPWARARDGAEGGGS